MAELKARGYTAISLDRLHDAQNNVGTPLPAKPIVLTFDDGYANVLTNAHPLLACQWIGPTPSIWSPTASVGATNGSSPKASPATPLLTRAQIAEMQTYSGVAFEAHTLTHPKLAEIDPECGAARDRRRQRSPGANAGKSRPPLLLPLRQPQRPCRRMRARRRLSDRDHHRLRSRVAPNPTTRCACRASRSTTSRRFRSPTDPGRSISAGAWKQGKISGSRSLFTDIRALSTNVPLPASARYAELTAMATVTSQPKGCVATAQNVLAGTAASRRGESEARWVA